MYLENGSEFCRTVRVVELPDKEAAELLTAEINTIRYKNDNNKLTENVVSVRYWSHFSQYFISNEARTDIFRPLIDFVHEITSQVHNLNFKI